MNEAGISLFHHTLLTRLFTTVNSQTTFTETIMKPLLFVIALLGAMSATAGHHGERLTTADGMTLYTFDKDKKGVSACYDGCAAKWPPYLATNSVNAKKGWKMIERKDGTQQSVYKGQPLYTWVGDQKPGEATGDGVGGVWHIVEKVSPPKASTTDSYGSGY
ncbi:hypothetical protein N9J26_00290 [bacterium]|nr:hypothetical protein [bacterium]